MKQLTTNEVLAVSGGWAQFVAGAIGAALVKDFIYDPGKEGIKNIWNHYLERGEAMAAECRSNPTACESRYSFYGDW